MESPDPRMRSGSGESITKLLALGTLYAAICFTSWAWGTGAPWALLAFRAFGLAALGLVALELWTGVPVPGRWAGRAAWSMIAFLVVSVLSGLVSIDRGKSLEAMLNLLALIGLFLAAALFVRGSRRLRSVALVQVVAALPVAVIGIAQYLRPDLLPASNSYPGRALGPFGQPNRLGGYLIAVIPIAVALAFTSPDRWLRAALCLGILLLTTCLILTFSRGAWIGLLASLVVLAAAAFRWPALAPRGAMLATVGVCLLLPALLLLPSILARLAPKPNAAAWNLPFDPEREGSGAMREAIWSGAIRAAEARPVLGFGVGTFREAFDRMKDDRMKRLEAEGTRTADNAHNQYLELLSERGVLGLAAFLVLAVVGLAAAAALAGAAGGGAARWLAVGLMAAVAALLVHGAFDLNLSLVPHQTLFYADLGVLAAAAPGTARRVRRSRIAGVLAGVLVLSGLGLSSTSFAAARDAEAGALRAAEGQPARAAEAWRAATRLSPWNDTYSVGLAHAEEAAAREGGMERLHRAEAAYRSAIRANGSDPVTREELARLYLSHPEVWGAAGVSAARTELETALAQNPYYAEIRNDLGVALLRSGDRAGAEQAFRRAAEGRPGFVDPLLNLAAMSIDAGRPAEARDWVRQALRRDPQSDRARTLAAELGLEPGSLSGN
jgi:putative inorganic carbon (HCO3(-)) transporter